MSFQPKKIQWRTLWCLLVTFTTVQDCSNKGLNVTPTHTFDNATKGLTLHENRLVSLPSGLFENLKDLLGLNLKNNSLVSLSPNLFHSNTKLSYLWLNKNQLNWLPAEIFDNNRELIRLYLSENQLKTLPPGIFDNNKKLNYLELSHNQLTTLHNSILSNNQYLTELELSHNQLTTLPAPIFASNKNLIELKMNYNQLATLPVAIFANNNKITKLELSHNQLTTLPAPIFASNKNLIELKMNYNQLTTLPVAIFANNNKITKLSFISNRISQLHRDTFKHLTNLEILILQNNTLKHLPQGLLYYNRELQIILLQRNRITNLPKGFFGNNSKLKTMSLENNLLAELPEDILHGLNELRLFAAGNNRLKHIPDGFFKDATKLSTLSLANNMLPSGNPYSQFNSLKHLRFLMLHQNNITSKSISRGLLKNLVKLELLVVSYNNLKYIEDLSFYKCRYMNYIMLNNNGLRRIESWRTFYGAFRLRLLTLSDNPIEYIAQRAFYRNTYLESLYLAQTKIKSVSTLWFHTSAYKRATVINVFPTQTPTKIRISKNGDERIGLQYSGFQCGEFTRICELCMVGTYIYFHNKTVGCIDCPAGGFYDDSIAYFGERAYGNGCKMCDNGTFVHIKNAPGIQKTDCKPCPEGTKNKNFAGFEACSCQEGFYRLDRFEKCYFCPDYGVTCFNESMTLKPGYYWQWISQSEKEHYINFTNNLQISDDSYDRDLVTFNGSFPQHYQCPRSESCLGGLDANCAEGYTGPLCAVCDKKHYNLVATCFKCPTSGWLIFQISAVSLVVVAVLVLVIKVKRRRTTQYKRSIADVILARLKIIVSFYQISSSILDGFSYVQWPSALTKMSEYAKFVQLNVIQIAPLHCFNSRFKMDAYDHLVTTCSVTALVILMALVYYNLKRLYLCRSAKRSGKPVILSDLEATKEACYRNVFLFIFVTYPQTCSTIFQMLPAACHRICQDRSQTKCTFYLKADYSLTCFTDKYNRYVILAYAALIYPLAVPLLTVAALWKYHCKTLLKKPDDKLKNEKMNQNKIDAPCSQQNNQQRNRTYFSSTTSQANHNMRTKTRRIEILSEQQECTTDEIQENAKNNTKNHRSSFSKTEPEIPKPDSNEGLKRTTVENKQGCVKANGSESTTLTTLPIIAGMSFIFENYAENCWFWETIEMMRKLLLTSSLALVGAEGRTSLGVASIVSGCYAILHAHFKPIPDKFEHVLQLTSLLVTFANTCIGMMLKIDHAALLDADAKIMDSWIMTVLLVMANVVVTALVVVNYMKVVGQTIYSVMKNPRCSLACCLSVILTIDEVQSEARSMESSSGWKMKTQLQSGNEFAGLSMKDAAGEYGLTGIDMDEHYEDGDDQ